MWEVNNSYYCMATIITPGHVFREVGVLSVVGDKFSRKIMQDGIPKYFVYYKEWVDVKYIWGPYY